MNNIQLTDLLDGGDVNHIDSFMDIIVNRNMSCNCWWTADKQIRNVKTIVTAGKDGCLG